MYASMYVSQCIIENDRDIYDQRSVMSQYTFSKDIGCYGAGQCVGQCMGPSVAVLMVIVGNVERECVCMSSGIDCD